MTTGFHTDDFALWERHLNDLHQLLAPHFARTEPRARVRRYLLGLLSNTERKNGWFLAETMHEPGPQGMQRLLNAAEWDADAVRDVLRTYVLAHLGAPDGRLVLDETGFLKKGTHSAGVARQYSGTAGRIENQQIGVFLVYASIHGAAFLDRALYLPEEWTQNPTRCRQAGVPDTVTFATKPALAQQMLARAVAAGVPARWVVADTVYNTDELRLWLQEQGLSYVLAAPCTYGVWTQGEQVEAAHLIAQVSPAEWVRLSAGEGSQGPRLYDWTWVQLPYRAAPGMSHWLIARRSISDATAVAYYHAYAPSSSTLADLVTVAGGRWVIETAFAQAKGEVGLDHYQVRQWMAWYRHVTLVLLAYAFLVGLRAAQPAAPPDQVRLSVPELRRVLHSWAGAEHERQRRLGWSQWRRRHQATAQRGHQRRRQHGREPVPLTLALQPARRVQGIGSLTALGWEQVVLLLPTRRSPVGRPTIDPRPLLEAIVWVMQTGVSWRAIPASFGPWQTVHMRYQQWVKAGIWEQVVPLLDLAPPGPAAAQVLL